jgi:hypothetical protein
LNSHRQANKLTGLALKGLIEPQRRS